MRECRRLALVTLGAALVAGAARAQEVQGPEVVRIGLVNSLFRDQPEALVMALMKPFSAMVESQTGLKGELVTGGGATKLGKLLATNKIQLAVFHGVEFAWARQLHPALRPLVIAVNQDPHLRALLVARRDSPAKGWKDLKHGILALPAGSRDHCYMFLDHGCQATGLTASKLFARTTTPPNSEEALDDVVDREADAVVVDGLAYDNFQRRKPGRAGELKVLARSPIFPAAVVAYQPGALSQQQLEQFRDGMLAANRTSLGRQLMTLWKLTGFAPVPADYDETLTNILKAYPRPAGAK